LNDAEKPLNGKGIPLPPDTLVLQWHITERCNRRCLHCYQEGPPRTELPFKDLLRILGQFTELLDDLSERTGAPVRGHINVTGGEPFIREDFLDLLEAFHATGDQIRFGILSNGSFIDGVMAGRLRALNVQSIQVSMEGTQETNDRIRGEGAYEQTVSALEHLVRERIPTAISFTAHRGNFREFIDVARLGRKLGVTRIWSDRLIPWGTGQGLAQQGLSRDETREFFEIMYEAHNEGLRTFCTSQIFMYRALQFLVAGGTPYRCGAAHRIISLQPNGDLFPCRRMPIPAGNVMERRLVDLYHDSELFQALREPNRISEGCRDCSFERKCRGGLRCLSFAVTGDPFRADPGCWRASQPAPALGPISFDGQRGPG
jgi:radical SAM protein with 4Fe4S-binding SPASM domain